MEMVDEISISAGFPTQLMPLSTVLLVSMLKDAYEDYKRYRNDKNENIERKAEVYEPQK